MTLIIKVKILNEHAKLPKYGSEEALGADLCSIEDITIPTKEWRMVSNGIAIAPNKFCDMQVRPRSGLAAKHGVTVLNAPGTVDPDYRGELKTILINHGNEDFHIKCGDRIAQLVANNMCASFATQDNVLERAIFKEVDELDETVRGVGGFGSTGVK